MNDYLRLFPDREAQMRETVAYFDGINFAPLITAPMMVYIGLNDDVCPPETGYALKNAMTCPVEFHATPRAAHDAGRYWITPKVEAFLAKHLQPAATQYRAEPTVG
jgi:cephalosporin-C deacetylase